MTSVIVNAKRDFIKTLVAETKGRFFTVKAKRVKPKKNKETGEIEHFMTMTLRTGVKKHLKGGESTIAHKPELIGGYKSQTDDSGYRCFNADLVTEFTFQGEKVTFTV